MESYRLQVERLYERSPFYRNKLRGAGFESPRAVGGLDRIAALPFTEKDELRASQVEQPPLGAHAAIEIAQAARIYSTSGKWPIRCPHRASAASIRYGIRLIDSMPPVSTTSASPSRI